MVALALLLLLSPQGSGPHASGSQASGPKMVGGSFVNMRTQPNAKASVVARLPFGLIVDAGKEKNGFVAVRIAGFSGYVWQGLLRSPNAAPTQADLRLIDSLTRPVACGPQFKIPNCIFFGHPEEAFAAMDALCAKRPSPEKCATALDARRAAERVTAVERRETFRFSKQMNALTGTPKKSWLKRKKKSPPVAAQPSSVVEGKLEYWDVLLEHYGQLPAAILAKHKVWSQPNHSSVQVVDEENLAAALLRRVPDPPKKLDEELRKRLESLTAVPVLIREKRLTFRIDENQGFIKRPIEVLQKVFEPKWTFLEDERVPQTQTSLSFVILPLSKKRTRREKKLGPSFVKKNAKKLKSALRWRESSPWVPQEVDVTNGDALLFFTKNAKARTLLLESNRLTHSTSSFKQKGLRSVLREYDVNDDGEADFLHIRLITGDGSSHGSRTEYLWVPGKTGWKKVLIFFIRWSDV